MGKKKFQIFLSVLCLTLTGPFPALATGPATPSNGDKPLEAFESIMEEPAGPETDDGEFKSDNEEMTGDNGEREDMELINDLASSALSQEELSALQDSLDTCAGLLVFADALLALLFGGLLALILSLFLR